MEPYVSRVTLTLPVVDSARELIFLVTGEGKAEALRRALGGPDPSAPVQPRDEQRREGRLRRRGGEPAVKQASGAQPVKGDAFPPIADYGFLSDCETCALMAPNGNVEWLCLPRFDSPSVFGSLLDRDAGGFRLGPDGVDVPAARRYLPGTMVIETSWGTKGGWIIVRDVLLIGPWHHENDRSEHPPPLARPTTTPTTCCCAPCAA